MNSIIFENRQFFWQKVRTTLEPLGVVSRHQNLSGLSGLNRHPGNIIHMPQIYGFSNWLWMDELLFLGVVRVLLLRVTDILREVRVADVLRWIGSDGRLMGIGWRAVVVLGRVGWGGVHDTGASGRAVNAFVLLLHLLVVAVDNAEEVERYGDAHN